MPYTANVYRVIIASPSDVVAERDIAQEVLAMWNCLHSISRRIVLLPIGWKTHSSPELGDRPQAIISKQLRIADLLIAVFWTRLGTPTGTYPSGSVEEVEEHLKAGKTVMIYFSSAKIDPGVIEDGQYLALMLQKKDWMKRGLVWEFRDADDFRKLFTAHVQHKLNDEARFPGYQESTPEMEMPVIVPGRISDVVERQSVLASLSLPEKEIINKAHELGWIHVNRTSSRGQFVGDFVKLDDPAYQETYLDAFNSLVGKGFVRAEGSEYKLSEGSRSSQFAEAATVS
jgi:hypothetical protein